MSLDEQQLCEIVAMFVSAWARGDEEVTIPDSHLRTFFDAQMLGGATTSLNAKSPPSGKGGP